MKRVAVFGLGNISSRHRANIKALFPDAEVLAYSASGRSAENIENADLIISDVSEALDKEIDLAIVATPATHHSSIVKKLLVCNIPILIEKPIAATASDARFILSLDNTNVFVGYCLRFLDSASYLHEYLKEAPIGRLVSVNASVGQYLPDWRPSKDYRLSVSAQRRLGGGVLLELSHELDYLQWFLGALSFESGSIRGSSELEADVEQVADLQFRSQEGVICNLHLDFLQKAPQRYCTFIGVDGRLEWDLVENSIYQYTSSGKSIVFENSNADRNEMYLRMLSAVISNDKQEKLKLATVDESVQLVELIENVKLKAKRYSQ